MADSSPKLGERILQARHAAKKASQNIANQLSSSEEERENPPKRSTAKKPRGKLKTPDLRKKPSKSLRSAIAHSQSSPVALSSAPKGKKRKVSELPSPQLNDDDDDDATSSLSSFPSSPVRPRSTHSLPARRKSGSGKFKQSLEPKTPVKSTPRSNQSNHQWNIIDCTSFVFVLVDSSGEAIDEGYEGSGALMWWPGKVASVSPFSKPLCIAAYHQVTSTSPGILKLKSPSPSNIQPMKDERGNIRFEATSFALSQSKAASLVHPPRKRSKPDPEAVDADIVGRWKLALQKMLEEYSDEGDDAAFSEVAYEPVGTSAKRAGASNARSVPDEDLSNALPVPDPMLEIPGELVLARTKRSFLYWPAKLEAFVPGQKQKPKYSVLFLDRTSMDIPRDWFFTSEETEFATCKMGVWESSHREDSASESEAEDAVDDAGRFSSPEPILPVPSPEDFVQLSIPQQFTYVKPVLIATLNGSYEPAKQRHSDFIKGGKHREGVKKNVVMRGNISVDEVRKFTRYLNWWALGDERRAVAIPEAHPGATLEDTVSGSNADPVAEASVAQDTSGMNQQSQIHLDQTQEHATRSDEPVVNTVSEARAAQDANHASEIPGEQTKEELVEGDNEGADSAVDGTAIGQESSGVDGVNHGGAETRKEPLTGDAVSMLSNMRRNLTADRSLSEFPGPPPNAHPETLPSRLQSLQVQTEGSQPDNRVTALKEIERSRQRGCPEFEALSGVDKLEYVLNVLHYEAILQTILWRLGKRTSLELLSPDQEQKLRDVALQEALATDWVRDVQRLRIAKERLLRKRAPKERAVVGGTRSRPRTVTRS